MSHHFKDKYKYQEPNYTESLKGVPAPKFPVDGFVCIRRVYNRYVGWLYYLRWNQWVSEGNFESRRWITQASPPIPKRYYLPRKVDIVGWEKLEWNGEEDWAVPLPKYHIDGIIVLKRKYFPFESEEWYEGWLYRMCDGETVYESRVPLYQGWEGTFE